MKGKRNNDLPPSKDLYHIKITTVGAKHTNGCEPGAKQYTLARIKAGEYAHATLQVLAQLVSHMILRSTTVVDPNYIQELMKKSLPARKAINYLDIYNLRIRALMLIKKMKSENLDIDKFEFKPDMAEYLFTPLDEVTDNILDNAAVCACELYYEFMNSDENSFTLFSFLESLASKDKGFTYDVAQDSNGKMTGFSWMTSVMRSNFERYNCVIFLDAMKRKTNIHLWPYMSIVIVNDLGESHPA